MRNVVANRRVFCRGLLLTAAIAGGGATRPALAEDAEGFVRSVGDAVVKVLQRQQPRAETEQQLHAIWLKAFDGEGIGRSVMGKNWKKASDAQREEYLNLFPQYVAGLYANQFSDYSGETFAVNGSKPGADGRTVVNAQIDRPRGEPIKVDFIVKTDGQPPLITDVNVEGVSLLVTKRSEFDSVVAQRGIDGLIAALRDNAG